MKKERKLFIKEHEDEQCYYAILGVLEDRNREVLSVVNRPTEKVIYWKEEFEAKVSVELMMFLQNSNESNYSVVRCINCY